MIFCQSALMVYISIFFSVLVEFLLQSFFHNSLLAFIFMYICTYIHDALPFLSPRDNAPAKQLTIDASSVTTLILTAVMTVSYIWRDIPVYCLSYCFVIDG